MDVIKLYLDMDGVLCDFDKRYIELFDETPGSSRDKRNFSGNWIEFIEGENFATLDWNPGGQELLAYVRTLPKDIEIEMLTSSGGMKYHNEVTIQKTQWLCERGIEYKINTGHSSYTVLYTTEVMYGVRFEHPSCTIHYIFEINIHLIFF